jgi:hypothetical protein
MNVLIVLGKSTETPPLNQRRLCEEEMLGDRWDACPRRRNELWGLWLGDRIWTLESPMVDAVEFSMFDMTRTPPRRSIMPGASVDKVEAHAGKMTAYLIRTPTVQSGMKPTQYEVVLHDKSVARVRAVCMIRPIAHTPVLHVVLSLDLPPKWEIDYLSPHTVIH